MERLIADANKLAIEQGLVDESALKLVIDEEAVAKALDAVSNAELDVSKKTTALQKAQLSYSEAVEKSGASSTRAQRAALSLKTAQENLEASQKKLAKAQESLTTAQKGYVTAFDINSYADIVEAIHIVQDEMGITGTTALEASETISGSVASMKSAWQNLVTGIADENADFDRLVDDLVSTVGTAAENILPRIETALGGVGKLVEGLAPVIAESLPSLMERVLPSLQTAATGLVNSLVDQLPSLAATGVTLFGTLLDNTPDIILNLTGKLPDVIDGLMDKLTEDEFLDKIVNTGVDLFVGLLDDIPKILESLGKGVVRLVNGIAERITDPENIKKIGEALGNLFLWAVEPRWTKTYANEIDALANPDSITEELWNRLSVSIRNQLQGRNNKYFSDAELAGMSFAEAVKNGIINQLEEDKEVVYGRIKNFTEDAIPTADVMSLRGRALGEALSESVESGFKSDIGDVKKEIVNEFRGIVDNVEKEMGIKSPSTVFQRIGGYMAEGVGVGFANKIPDIKRSIRQQMRGIVSAVQNEMQIASPSKVFASIGRYMAQGLERGWESEIGDVNAVITDSMGGYDPQSSTQRGGNVYNIYAQKMTPAEIFEEAARVEADRRFLGIGGADVLYTT